MAHGQTFTTEPAADLTPYIAAEQAKDAVQYNTGHRSGVRYSGLYDAEARTPRTFDEVLAAAVAEKQRNDAFRASPRGRFLACLRELEETGSAADADRLRGIYFRALTNGPDWPLDTQAIGSALVILEGIQTSTAREARLALCEILITGKVRS